MIVSTFSSWSHGQLYRKSPFPSFLSPPAELILFAKVSIRPLPRNKDGSYFPEDLQYLLRSNHCYCGRYAVSSSPAHILAPTDIGTSFGFDISSMSAIVDTKQYLEYFDNPHGIIQGAIGSALAAGSVVGSLIAGPISDKYGRRDSIFFACFWWLIGTAVQVSCKNYGQLIAGRILNGVCVGITSSQVPSTWPKSRRKTDVDALL